MDHESSVKIATWNVYNRVKDPHRILQFIRKEIRTDIFFFQELIPDHIKSLEALRDEGYSFHSVIDWFDGGSPAFLGVLTKLPVIKVEKIPINSYMLPNTAAVGRYLRWIECIDALAVTVEVKGTPWTFVNVHLSASCAPSIRTRELSRILAHPSLTTNAGPVVLAGDFNSFARPRLNWLVGPFFSFARKELHCDELLALEKRLLHHGFTTVHPGVTYPAFGLALDHVFMKNVQASGFNVSKKTHGSDHRPLSATLKHLQVPTLYHTDLRELFSEGLSKLAPR